MSYEKDSIISSFDYYLKEFKIFTDKEHKEAHYYQGVCVGLLIAINHSKHNQIFNTLLAFQPHKIIVDLKNGTIEVLEEAPEDAEIQAAIKTENELFTGKHQPHDQE